MKKAKNAIAFATRVLYTECSGDKNKNHFEIKMHLNKQF
jgi:hypothetical protein